jgi:hypothetical protein
MSWGEVGSLLLIVGSLVFLTGAAIGVPRVFSERDRGKRLRMLNEHINAWRWAQPLYALGPVIAAAGVGFVAAGTSDAAVRALLAVACAALGVGALSWSWIVYLRGTRVSDFAFGRLPGWPFALYVDLTIAGLFLLGVALLSGDFPAWIGWVTVAADSVFLVGYVRYRDLPPFVFYLLLLGVGIVIR